MGIYEKTMTRCHCPWPIGRQHICSTITARRQRRKVIIKGKKNSKEKLTIKETLPNLGLLSLFEKGAKTLGSVMLRGFVTSMK